MKFTKLAQQYRDGKLTESDLEGVSSEDALSLRQEAGDGLLHVALGLEAFTGGKEEKEGEETKNRSASYIMVTDGLIPPFKDRVLHSAWRLKEFANRGSNILYDHNSQQSLPPIGKGKSLKKGVEIKRKGETFKALVGDVDFVPVGIFPFADLVSELVVMGYLTNFSVGFDIIDARPATEKEIEDQGLRTWSSIMTKVNLVEGSITPLGRDPRAQKMSASGEEEGSLLDILESWDRLGVRDENAVGMMRQSVLSSSGEAERFSIIVPQCSWADDDEDVPPIEEAEESEGVSQDDTIKRLAARLEVVEKELVTMKADAINLDGDPGLESNTDTDGDFYAQAFGIADESASESGGDPEEADTSLAELGL